MNKAEKAKSLDMLKSVFAESGVVVVAQYSGLSVAKMSVLRSDLLHKGGRFKVIKNRLAKIALDGKGGDQLAGLFTGPTGIAYSDDPVVAPKSLVNFAKENEQLIILGGFMGETFLDGDGVRQLASLPSLDELRGKLVGVIQAPATKLAGVLQAPASQLARLASAYGSKEDAA